MFIFFCCFAVALWTSKCDKEIPCIDSLDSEKMRKKAEELFDDEMIIVRWENGYRGLAVK